MTGVGDDSRGRFPGAPALVVGFTLAVGATLALVFTEDLRWLRLAIVAALWAALIGAFFAVRYRKQAAATAESVAQAQAVYELELEREIAARREFELEIEAETRDRVEADSREELEALRNEVTALRESLQSLFGGEVLYERVALTAQSTRMRSLNDEPKVVNGGESNGKPKAQLTSGQQPDSAARGEHPTEMMNKVRDGEPEFGIARRTPPKQAKPQVAVPRAAPQAQPHKPQAPQKPLQPPRPPAQQPAPAQQREQENAKTQQVPRAPRTPQDSGPPTRRVPLNEVGSVAAKAAKAAGEARAEAARAQQREDATVAGMRPVQPQPQPQPQQPPPPAPPHRTAPPAAVPRRPAPSGQREPEQHELTRPAMERIARGRSAASVVPEDPRRGAERPEPAREPEPVAEPQPEFDFEWMSAWTGESRAEGDDTADAGDSADPAVEDDTAGGTGRHGTNGYGTNGYGTNGYGTNGYGSPEPEPVPEAGPAPEVPEPNPTLPESVRDLQRGSRPGGRRRRAEDDPPWQGFGERERPDEESGSHAEGRSVSELLAAHGSGATPRRRRRAED